MTYDRRFAAIGGLRRGVRSPSGGGVAGPYDFAQYAAPSLHLVKGDWTNTSGEISAWNDQAGNWTVSKASNRPDIVDGRADFDSAASESLNLTGHTPVATGGLTLFALINNRSITSTQYMVDLNGASGRVIFCIETNGGLMGFFDGSFRNVASAESVTGEQWLAWRYNGATSLGRCFRNGTNLGGATLGTVTTIGAVSSGLICGPAFPNLQLDRLVLYETALSDAQILDVGANLGDGL